MRTRTMILAAVAASTLGLATVQARPRFGMGSGPMMMGPGGMDGPAMMLPLLLRRANLTDEQQAQVQKIMADRRAQTRALVREMHAAQAALLDKLFTAGDLKADDLKPEMDRLNRARMQLMDHALTTALDVRKVLTAEQLARTAKIKDRMRALHDQMRELMDEGEE
jgi:Spy/CpxP family protein refolding chaperone